MNFPCLLNIKSDSLWYLISIITKLSVINIDNLISKALNIQIWVSNYKTQKAKEDAGIS